MKIEKLTIITNKYPNEFEPNVLVFLQQLVWQFAKLGIKCSVISPMPVNINPKYAGMPYKSVEKTDTGEEITVYRPKYIGFGQKTFGKFNTAKITTSLFEKAVLRVIRKNGLEKDVLYSHFVTPAGITAARLGKKLGVPSFMAHGESTPATMKHFGIDAVKKELSSLTGIIAVSQYNRKMLTDLGVASDGIIGVFPNAYNPARFYKTDKSEAREKLGFDKEDFIVGFVGSFDERKGVLRLQEAVDLLEGVKFACAGKGKLVPGGENCVYASPVRHDNLVDFYNSCDIFALPTRNEGCCNAIVEAIACGVPIISSDRLFNYDILSGENAVLIEPDDVNALSSAISELKNDPARREAMSRFSLSRALELTVESRAKNIICFIEERT